MSGGCQRGRVCQLAGQPACRLADLPDCQQAGQPCAPPACSYVWRPISFSDSGLMRMACLHGADRGRGRDCSMGGGSGFRLGRAGRAGAGQTRDHQTGRQAVQLPLHATQHVCPIAPATAGCSHALCVGHFLPAADPDNGAAATQHHQPARRAPPRLGGVDQHGVALAPAAPKVLITPVWAGWEQERAVHRQQSWHAGHEHATMHCCCSGAAAASNNLNSQPGMESSCTNDTLQCSPAQHPDAPAIVPLLPHLLPAGHTPGAGCRRLWYCCCCCAAWSMRLRCCPRRRPAEAVPPSPPPSQATASVCAIRQRLLH